MAIRIIENMLTTAAPAGTEPVVVEHRIFSGRPALRFEESVRVALLELRQHLQTIGRAQLESGRARLKDAHPPNLVGIPVRPEDRERIAVTRGAQQVAVVYGEGHGRQRRDGTRQMRRAYSPMARSEENTPMPATLWMAVLAQASRSR